MNPNELASMFGLPEAMGNNLPAAGGKGSHAAAFARQRLMGYGPPASVISDEEKERLREKRKKERQNKKKNRRR